MHKERKKMCVAVFAKGIENKGINTYGNALSNIFLRTKQLKEKEWDNTSTKEHCKILAEYLFMLMISLQQHIIWLIEHTFANSEIDLGHHGQGRWEL